MDLTIAGVTAYQQSQLDQKVQTTVEAKTLDIARQQGASGLELLQNATRGGISPGDTLTASATGLGAQVDAYA